MIDPARSDDGPRVSHAAQSDDGPRVSDATQSDDDADATHDERPPTCDAPASARDMDGADDRASRAREPVATRPAEGPLEWIDARVGLLQARLGGAERRLDAIRGLREEWTDEEHDPEGFAVISAWSLEEGARTAANDELQALRDARARVADGTYGTCEVCGLPIPAAQLELRPARRAHVACEPDPR